MERVTYVQADDWAGVYVDDELAVEGHQIQSREWLALLRRAGVAVVDGAESEEAYSVIQAHGACPPTLAAWGAIAREERARAEGSHD